jgi:AraC-like DNA-binding protein
MVEMIVSSAYDPLSSALMTMKLRALLHPALDAGGSWAVDFPAYDGLTLNVVRKGECWLSIKGHQEVVRLQAGDCFLLTGARPFSLAKSLAVKKRFRAEQLFSDAQRGVAVCQGGGDFFVNGTIFRFDGHLPTLLFRRLPPVIVIDGNSDQAAALRWNLERFGAELRGDSAGRSFMLGHLAPVMLLQALRMYLSSATKDENWLVALSHPRLSKALEAIQTDYRKNWSLEQLADLANMSRSGFALVFKKKVGVTPMDYLKHWRMQIACDLLRVGDEPLSAIASATGYGSESAFSTAFQKIFQCRPGAYRKSFSSRSG